MFYEKSSQSFKGLIKKLITLTLLSVLRSENENLAAKVLSVLKISTDTIEKNKRVYLFKNLLSLHCSHDWKIKLGFTMIRNTLSIKS